MNITIDQTLHDNSRKIDLGITFLHSQMTNVINKQNDSSECGSLNNVMDKYKQNIEAIKDATKIILKEQKDMEVLIQKTEQQQQQMQTELENIVKRNNINPMVWNCKQIKEANDENS